MPSISTLTRVQNWTGLAFSAFVAYHLAGHVLAAVVSVEAGDKWLLFGREFYQSPVGELLLVVLPLAGHQVANVLKRRQLLFPAGANEKAGEGKPLWHKLRALLTWRQLPVLSGYACSALLSVHIFGGSVESEAVGSLCSLSAKGTRIEPLLDPSKGALDVTKMLHLREEFGAGAVFAYLALLTGAVSYHGVTGVQKAGGLRRDSAASRLVAAAGVAGSLVLSWRLAFSAQSSEQTK